MQTAGFRYQRFAPFAVDASTCTPGLRMVRTPAAGRIWTGNGIDWQPPGGQRFDYVHIPLDAVPLVRRADLIRHHLDRTV